MPTLDAASDLRTPMADTGPQARTASSPAGPESQIPNQKPKITNQKSQMAAPGLAAFLARVGARLEAAEPFRRTGRVSQITGLVIESDGPAAVVGELCHVHPHPGHGRGEGIADCQLPIADSASQPPAGNGQSPIANRESEIGTRKWQMPHASPITAEVVGFRGNRMLLMPLDEVDGIGPGCRVVATGRPLRVSVGAGLLGRVVDGLGGPADGLGPLGCTEERIVAAAAPPPMSRRRIDEPLATGVRAIDGFLTLGRGQRVGIFSGSGLGKSVLVGEIARYSQADVNVVGLIGERGREVREFLHKNLGEEGLKKSVVVAVTSDDLALRRIKGAQVATAIAEHFRDQGLDVLLILDSITRFAYAQRELGLSIGEPPATRGYPPSLFAVLPRLLERTGHAARGSITGIYTILVEGDDLDEPVADAARSILDGHIVLSRDLTMRNHYPAIDILASLSRVMPDVAGREHCEAAGAIKRLYAAYRSSEDLIRLGAYVRGTNAELDLAVDLVDDIDRYLRQPTDERAEFAESVDRLVVSLAARARENRQPETASRK